VYATYDISIEYTYQKVIDLCGNIYIPKWQMAEKVHIIKCLHNRNTMKNQDIQNRSGVVYTKYQNEF